MKKRVLLITGNKRKIKQAKDVLAEFDIDVAVKDLDVPEIQSHDPIKVTIAKAKAAYERAGEPVLVCDFGWSVPALKGFPGSYMADMNHWFTPHDFLRLMDGVEDRTIILTDTVAYTDGTQTKHFTTTFNAKLIHEPRGKSPNMNEQITIYDGSEKTIAQHVEEGTHARDMSKTAWRHFAEWYSKQ